MRGWQYRKFRESVVESSNTSRASWMGVREEAETGQAHHVDHVSHPDPSVRLRRNDPLASAVGSVQEKEECSGDELLLASKG